MLYVAEPSPDLSGRIGTAWSFESREGRDRVFHEFFPGGGADLIFRFSESGCRLVLLGPATEKAAIQIDQGSHYIGLRFKAGQAPAVSGLSCEESNNNCIDLDKFQGESIDSLADRLLSLPDAPLRLRILENLARPARPMLRDPRCRRAVNAIETYEGRLSVNDLAYGMGINIRSLERMFREHLGITPKRLIRLVRFSSAAERLRTSGGRLNLAGLATSFGYTDQSHMIRDFRNLIGRAPGEIGPGFTGRLADAPRRIRVVHRVRS